MGQYFESTNVAHPQTKTTLVGSKRRLNLNVINPKNITNFYIIKKLSLYYLGYDLSLHYMSYGLVVSW